jgi:acylphosphatase
MRKRCQIYITGNVQRVGFRHHAFVKAQALEISGKAIYIDQGLFIEAEAFENRLAEFIEWCHTGPDLCRIESITVRDLEPAFLTGFEIMPGIVSGGKELDPFIRL